MGLTRELVLFAQLFLLLWAIYAHDSDRLFNIVEGPGMRASHFHFTLDMI